MFPVVVVDVIPADVPAEQAQLMIDACSGAVPSGACALASASPESLRPDAVALVLWQGPGELLATIRVGRRNGEWVTRQLAFSDADPPRDRWVAAGLTIATLLDESRGAALQATSLAATAVRPSAAPVNGASPRPTPKRSHENALSAGVLLGNGWDHGTPMTGVWATFSFGLLPRRWFALAGASYAVSSGPELEGSGQLHNRWLSVELGAGVQGQVASLRLFVAPQLAFQSVRVEPASGARSTDQELELKLRAGAVWEVAPHFGLCLGATGRVLPVGSPASDPKRVRRSGLSAELFAGFEFRL